MALQAYMPALQGAGHKASAQQIQECGGILSVNLFFADKDGGDLKIASHHRATAYDDYRREIARILS